MLNKIKTSHYLTGLLLILNLARYKACNYCHKLKRFHASSREGLRLVLSRIIIVMLGYHGRGITEKSASGSASGMEKSDFCSNPVPFMVMR